MTSPTHRELPPFPEPDERTRKGLAFSGFAMEAYARSAVAAALEQQAVPQGWKLVPEEALLACEKALNEYSQAPVDYHRSVLRMRDALRNLAAAPQATQSDPWPSSDQVALARQDADLLGRGFTVDGMRVAPERVVIVHRTAATQPTQAEAPSEREAKGLPDPLPLPPMRASIYVHPQLGELWDRLSVQLYAMGYADDSMRAALATQQAEAPSEREAREMQEVADKLREAGYHSAANNTERTIADIKSGIIPRAVIGATLATHTEQAGGEPVHQYRKQRCANWYDGHPDHLDGGGPYETRVLYTRSAPVQQVDALRCDAAGSPFQRYRLYEDGTMEPYSSGDWVTYADVCAALAAQPAAERMGLTDARYLNAMSGLVHMLMVHEDRDHVTAKKIAEQIAANGITATSGKEGGNGL